MTASLVLPTTAGSLEAYVGAVSRFPMLCADKERRLAQKVRERGDVEAARQLVLPHLRLVVAVARAHLGYGLPFADLIQEGNIGLIKALKRFDPARGVRFASFAIHWIRAEIREYVVRNWRLVRIATTKAQRKLFFNLRSLARREGAMGAQEAREIARELRVRPCDVAQMHARLAAPELSLEDAPGEDGAAPAPLERLAAGEENEPWRPLAEHESLHERSAALSRALARLDARSRRIIEARWLSAAGRATLRELAGELGVSLERVRQIEAKALEHMRRTIARHHEVREPGASRCLGTGRYSTPPASRRRGCG